MTEDHRGRDLKLFTALRLTALCGSLLGVAQLVPSSGPYRSPPVLLTHSFWLRGLKVLKLCEQKQDSVLLV